MITIEDIKKLIAKDETQRLFFAETIVELYVLEHNEDHFSPWMIVAQRSVSTRKKM